MDHMPLDKVITSNLIWYDKKKLKTGETGKRNYVTRLNQFYG